MTIISLEFVGATEDFNLVCHDIVAKKAPRKVLAAELKEKYRKAQSIVKNFTPNGSPFFENEKTETLNALVVRFEETHDAIANIKEIRALKRSLSAQKYVDNIISTVSNMPFQAARNAAQDLDFDNLKDVRRYQDNAHTVIWAVVESAMHIVNVLLWGPCLIDDEDVAKIRGDLYRSAEFHIKRVKAPSTAPVENEIGELAKPTCDICGNEEAWDTLDDFRVGKKCLHEMKSIAFTRATNEEHDSGLSEKRAGALSAIISTVHDKSQSAVLSSFISLLASQPNNFDYVLHRDLMLLAKKAEDRFKGL